MKHGILTKVGFRHGAAIHGPQDWSNPAFPEHAAHSPADEAEWQRHMVVGIWLALGLLLALCCALIFAQSHGVFDSLATDHVAPPTLQPDGP
jgi:hypothetical protein